MMPSADGAPPSSQVGPTPLAKLILWGVAFGLLAWSEVAGFFWTAVRF